MKDLFKICRMIIIAVIELFKFNCLKYFYWSKVETPNQRLSRKFIVFADALLLNYQQIMVSIRGVWPKRKSNAASNHNLAVPQGDTLNVPKDGIRSSYSDSTESLDASADSVKGHRRKSKTSEPSRIPSIKEERKVYVRIVPCNPPTRTVGSDPIYNVFYVNDDTKPLLINNEHFTGYAVFRCQNFDGWTPMDESSGKPLPPIPTCKYFEGHRRTFSLQISGRFRKPWTGDDVMFGTFFEKPLRLPRGYSIALKFAKQIDPSMVSVMDISQPYMCSPIICAMNSVHIQPLLDPKNPAFHQRIEKDSPVKRSYSVYQPFLVDLNRPNSNEKEIVYSNSTNGRITRSRDDLLDIVQPLPLLPWQWGGDKEPMEENLMANWHDWTQMPHRSAFYQHGNSSLDCVISKNKVSATARRQWFLNPEHRKRFIFDPDTIYSFDFASPYVDIGKMQLKLGINIDVEYYLGDQPVRYQCRSRDGRTVFWTVELARV